jgi:sugar lactone lactonase YvrE
LVRKITYKISFSPLLIFSRGDTLGNLFVPTITRIFKISTIGLVTTYAGNPRGSAADNTSATAALIGNAFRLVGDSNGNIYFYDMSFCRIRKISPGSKLVTNFIGEYGNCGFNGVENSPGLSTRVNRVTGMWLDSNGNLFYSDAYNRRIRKWSISTGLVNTIAGNGTYGFTDNRPATSAMIGSAIGIAGDSVGNIYFGDEGYGRIRKITTSGFLVTIAGGGVCCADMNANGVPATTVWLNSPGGLKVDAQGNVYFSTYGRVRMYESSTGLTYTSVGYGCSGFTNDGGSPLSACIASMEDFWMDTNNNFYLPQSASYRIRKATPSIITTIAGSGYFSFAGDGGPAVNAQLYTPMGTYVDTNGNAYIVDQGNCRIRLVNSAGIISTFGGTGSCTSTADGYAFTQTSLSSIYAVLGDTAGNLYLTQDNWVRRISAGSTIVTTISGAGSVNTDAVIAATSYNFNTPYGMSIDTNNNLFITEYGRHKIKKLSLSTFNIVTIAGSGSTTFVDNCPAMSAGLYYPRGIWVDTLGRYFIADSENRRIRKVENGIMTTYAGSGASGYNGDGHLATLTSFSSLYSIVGDSNGNIYVNDIYNNRIRKILRRTL